MNNGLETGLGLEIEFGKKKFDLPIPKTRI